MLQAAMPERDPGRMTERLGIRERRWAAPGTLPSELAADALRVALDDAGLQPSDLRHVIFATSTGGDHRTPATVNAVLARLGLHNTVGGFDIGNACTGYLSALDVAARLVATGVSPVGVVAAEVLSTFLDPSEPRPYVVFADAAGAAILGSSKTDCGLEASDFGNDGRRLRAVYLANAPFDSPHALSFGNRASEILKFAVDDLQLSVDAVLEQVGITLSDVDWIVTHQPNGLMLDAILAHFQVPEDRLVRVVDTLGSVAAASAAVGLDRLLRERPVKSGDRVLIMAVGGGASRGALLVRLGR
ncbi:MAG: 3-oxoacyl-[acyl-carrier-protein] synthase-3 [Myxococcota bacterium]